MPHFISKVMDHIIVAGNDTFSFSRDGLMPTDIRNCIEEAMEYTPYQQEAFNHLDGNL